jgi:hypothetical protein
MEAFIARHKPCNFHARVDAELLNQGGPAQWRTASGELIPGHPWQAWTTPLVTCSACGRALIAQRLQARTVESVRCDARCTSAKGHSCDCSCGGANHGQAA